jgi:hypothetical protein
MGRCRLSRLWSGGTVRFFGICVEAVSVLSAESADFLFNSKGKLSLFVHHKSHMT